MNIIFLILLILFNFFLYINLEKFSKKINIFDIPDKKLKRHKSKIPIVGGIIFFINLLFLILYQFFFLKSFIIFDIFSLDKREIFSILLLFFSFFLIGLYDDKYNLSPKNKIIYLTIFIVVTILINKKLLISNFNISFLDKKIFLNDFSILFTVFSIIIITNALNFYDGINGQSLGFFFIVLSFLFIKSQLNIFYLIIIFIISFLLFLNLNKKLFLGDSGIYLISSLVSISLIYEYNVKKNIIFVDEIFFLLLVPGLDLVRLTFERILSGKNALHGDRNHIHHLLINKISLFKANIILLFIGILPVFLFSFFKLNFFTVFFIIIILFYSLILFLKKKV